MIIPKNQCIGLKKKVNGTSLRKVMINIVNNQIQTKNNTTRNFKLKILNLLRIICLPNQKQIDK